MSKRAYEALSVSCDLSEAAVLDAFERLGPSFDYDIYVASVEAANVRAWLNRMERGFLHPAMNLHIDPTFTRNEWCIEANGKAVGSNSWN